MVEHSLIKLSIIRLGKAKFVCNLFLRNTEARFFPIRCICCGVYNLTWSKINSTKFFFYFPVPSAAPGQVLVTAKSSTSLHISWLALPQEHRLGKIRMHKIYVSLATQPKSYINTYFAYNSVEYNISDLRVFTLHVIRVSALNEAGEGPKSEAVTARTSEGGEFISYQ